MLTEKQKDLIHDRLYRVYNVLQYVDKDTLYEDQDERQKAFSDAFYFERDMFNRLVEKIIDKHVKDKMIQEFKKEETSV